MAKAAVEEISEIEALDEARLQCRLQRVHAMRATEVEKSIRPGSIGYRVIFRCQDCGRVRNDVISWYNGDLLARWYDDDGYYRWVGEKLTMGDVRLETLRRLGLPLGNQVKLDDKPVKKTAKKRRLTAV